MADDKGKKPAPPASATSGDVLARIFGMILLIVFVSTLLTSFQRFLGTRLDRDFSFVSFLSQFSDKVTDSTSLGTLVTTRRDTSVWKTSLHNTLFGIQQGGSLGRLIAGPVIDDAGSWWNVDFELSPDGWVNARDLSKSMGWFASFKRVYVWLAWIFSILAVAGIVYVSRKHDEVIKGHKEQMKLLEQKIAGVTVANRNEKWERIKDLSASESPADWRIAILEADVMLDELLKSMALHGETLGDRLKAVEPSDFGTLESAWEAHKIRNRIAHHGSDFILTHREAKRVIDLYRQVFEEFDVV